MRDTLAAVAATLRHWRRQRDVFRILIAYDLFNDVLVTLVFFIAIVMRARFGLSIEGLLWLAMLYHLIALPATLAFGHVADRWGQHPTICLMVAILGVGLLLLAFGTGIRAAVIVVILLGLVYGSLQAVCRSLLALLVRSHSSAEIFGFNAVAGRLSAALGPLLFSAVAAASGSEAAAWSRCCHFWLRVGPCSARFAFRTHGSRATPLGGSLSRGQLRGGGVSVRVVTRGANLPHSRSTLPCLYTRSWRNRSEDDASVTNAKSPRCSLWRRKKAERDFMRW